ncbi:hypothetical protein EW026_g7939 [Hermanssonia centrifuga]|uniref:Uncharacterized protein n=1 Tax=Hermanssonia centrifuga TaxID=98765 RepID=A0A4S4K657_9APHY|nr:hypothetical protein EW026_g7939 [Hermanssonia centrifuga]
MARANIRNENAGPPARRAALSDNKKAERRERFKDLKNDLATTRNIFAAGAREIAKKYGRTERWTKRQVLMSTVTQRRKPNAWNAFIRTKLKNHNEGRATGHRIQLHEYLRDHAEELRDEYDKLTSAEKRAYREELLALREERSTMKARDNPKAVQIEVRSTFGNLKQDGVRVFFIAVRGSIEDHHEPQAIYTGGAGKFVRDILKMEPGILTLKFESNVVSSAGTESQVPGAPAKFNKTQAVSNVRGHIQEKLNEILKRSDVRVIRKGKEKEIKMNYDNYEGKIVERYGVELVGFPCTLTNPANLGRTDLEKAIAAFDTGTCYWRKLSKCELEVRIKSNQGRQAAGEQVYKARKVAPRKQRGNPKSAEIIINDNDDDEQEDEVPEVTQPNEVTETRTTDNSTGP